MSELDRIVSDLHSDDVDLAIAAAHALDKRADESWLPRLHELLATGPDVQLPNFGIREAVAAPICRLEGLRAMPQLLNAMEFGSEEGHDNDGLAALISDLVCDNPTEAAPMLVRMIDSPSQRERTNTAWLWGYAASVLSPGPLLTLLSDPSASVRSVAAGSLASFKGREDVFAALLTALEDPSDDVKTSAASALGYYDDRRAIEPLRKLRSDSSRAVRRTGDYALERLEKM